ncbi:conserved hypothetical protein [Coccidioides posadasii str. Silveira]|uniref:Uncharacterized protein n=1 Tax=Coccidioides posadasii (strain RMSCC 757 / Silveira) TaxID=443226 RepID=E9D5T5_COCPS|nr:conserved hypothetical protein [Coccidioides posadasii str. Silveira]
MRAENPPRSISVWLDKLLGRSLDEEPKQRMEKQVRHNEPGSPNDSSSTIGASGDGIRKKYSEAQQMLYNSGYRVVLGRVVTAVYIARDALSYERPEGLSVAT